MPTYEYVCNDCMDRFDVLQSIKDDPLKKCTKCGGKLKRVIGAGAGIIFKGSGFYITDNKGRSSIGGSGKKSDTAGSTPSASESSTKDTKTAVEKSAGCEAAS